jgi:hypothetical protein
MSSDMTHNVAARDALRKPSTRQVQTASFVILLVICLLTKATLKLYRIAFRSGAKKHLSNSECTTIRSYKAKQNLSVAI